jgi:hypothetical protein
MRPRFDHSEPRGRGAAGIRLTRTGHGSSRGVDETTWLGDDPALALVTGDLDAWLAAHPCTCEGLCVCDGDADA